MYFITQVKEYNKKMNEKNFNENFIDSNFKKFYNFFTLNRRLAFFTTFILGMLIHFNRYSQNLLTTDAYALGCTGNLNNWHISL